MSAPSGPAGNNAPASLPGSDLLELSILAKELCVAFQELRLS